MLANILESYVTAYIYCSGQQQHSAHSELLSMSHPSLMAGGAARGFTCPHGQRAGSSETAPDACLFISYEKG